MATWLITGAAGFIGSNLGAHLLERGDTVIGLDDLSTGTRDNVDRLAALAGARFRFHEGSILDPALVARSLSGVDVVVHLAAQVSVQRSFEQVAYTNAVNVAGFLEVYGAAEKAGVKRLIYASSCAVYGDNPTLPLAEETPPQPLSPYAVSKLVNEQYAEVLRLRCDKMDAIGLRFFNIYGPWQDHRGGYAAVIPRWIDACLRGERRSSSATAAPRATSASSATSRASSRRSDETAPAETSASSTWAPASPPASPNSTPPSPLLSARAGVTPPREGPLHQPWRAGDIVHSRGSVERLRREVGIVPRTDLATGIGRLLEEQYGLRR